MLSTVRCAVCTLVNKILSLCLYGVYDLIRKKIERFIRMNFKVSRICHFGIFIILSARH